MYSENFHQVHFYQSCWSSIEKFARSRLTHVLEHWVNFGASSCLTYMIENVCVKRITTLESNNGDRTEIESKYCFCDT